MNREETIFEQALGIGSPQAREEFLRGACVGNQAMFERVQGLLRAHDRAGKFLEHDRPADGARLSPFVVPPSGGAAPGPAEAGTPNLLTEKPGDRIGRYKLLQKIGEGGCGVVYMAEQEEPVRRRVALKIIKLGMDTRSVIARFEAERQALAIMDHPNIARIFDAGITEAPLPASGHPLPSAAEGRGQGEGSPPVTRHPSLATHYGRPYFVMELVRGIKITEYCDEKKLTTQQRLELFTQVCRAVQHAHQKGIIHRDLKPSNILVSFNDGVAVPKVIDFGIAKATTGEPLTDKTVFTTFEQFIGTPAYMSPEQALVTSLDIDTRTDIYALGVLLYELLTGHTPFDPKELLKAGLDEMRRTIREKEPERPSTRLSTLPGEALNTTAQRRGLDAPKLVSQLRGDLDWIVMKCLEKDRARRYETANGLASDIQRHLSSEPVLACPPSNLYKFQKLVQRNKLAFAAGAGIAAALITGLCVATWGLVRAVSAEKEQARLRQQAQIEAARSRQVAQILKDMLQSVGPSVASGSDTKLMREILDRTAERLGKELITEPEVEAELRFTIGSVYFELSQPNKATAMYWQSLDLWKKAGIKENEALADTLHQLAYSHHVNSKNEEGEKLERQAMSVYERLHGHEHTRVGVALNNLALMLLDQGKLTEGEAAAREALRMNQKSLDRQHPYVGLSLNRLGRILEAQRKLDDADSAYREAVAIQKKALGSEPLFGLGSHHIELAWTLHWQSGVFVDQGRLAEAEQACQDSLATARMVLSDEHPDIALFTVRLAEVLTEEKRLEEAEHLFREAIELGRKKPGEREFFMLRPLVQLRDLALKKGEPAEAQAAYAEILAIARRSPPDVRIAFRLRQLTQQLLGERNFAEAELRAQDCLAIYEKTKPNDPRAFRARMLLVAALLGQKKHAEAEREYRLLADGLRKAGDGGDVQALKDSAWLLATCPHAEVRDGRLAIMYAEKAVTLTSRTNAMFLDTLAAAHAEAGDFPKAVSVQNEAMGLLHTEAEQKNYASRLKLYESGSPYRE